MIKVVFVCTGNICRSPMAEAVMQDLVEKAGLSDQIEVDSAGIISYHSGELADPRARRVLADHDIDYLGDARKITEEDFEADYLIGMSKEHVDELGWAKPRGTQPKIHLLLEFADDAFGQEVEDPYYAGGFDKTYELVEAGCKGLLEHIIQEHHLTQNQSKS